MSNNKNSSSSPSSSPRSSSSAAAAASPLVTTTAQEHASKRARGDGKARVMALWDELKATFVRYAKEKKLYVDWRLKGEEEARATAVRDEAKAHLLALHTQLKQVAAEAGEVYWTAFGLGLSRDERRQEGSLRFVAHLEKDKAKIFGPASVARDAALPYGVAEHCGVRDDHEDRWHVWPRVGGDSELTLYGVFDGVLGVDAAQHCTDCVGFYLEGSGCDLRKEPGRALTHAYLETSAAISKPNTFSCFFEGYCTAISALVAKSATAGTTLTVANTGDSRAVLIRADGTTQALSRDQNVERADERERVLAAGATIEGKYCGRLAYTRAMGCNVELPDYRGKIPDPEITTHRVERGDRFLVLASDGLWDVFDENVLRRGEDWSDAFVPDAGTVLRNAGAMDGSAQDAAIVLCKHATRFSVKSQPDKAVDNVTVVVVDLRGGGGE